MKLWSLLTGRRKSFLERQRDRLPDLSEAAEWSARIGYGARGFVYLSIGLVLLLGVLELVPEAVGSTGAMSLLVEQPLGRVWLVTLGLGLWCFVLWRVLQSIFDADREGLDARGIGLRLGQAVSGLFYGLLASSAFELLDETGIHMPSEDVAKNQQKAAMLLDLPFGGMALLGVGLIIAGVGIGNIIKGFRANFAGDLSCSRDLCRRIVPIARAGYIARGLAYLPLALFVTLAGWQARAADVPSFGSALQALESQPGGNIMLGLTAIGLMAFGLFAMIEGRFRKIRAPGELE